MKTTIFSKILLACFAIIVIITPSCKKETDAMTPPNLSLNPNAPFISADCTLPMNDTIHVGIIASKSEDKDLLTRFVETQKYDGGASTTVDNESFNQDTFSKDITIITRGIAGTEVYTFTIINRDGLTATKTLTFTVL